MPAIAALLPSLDKFSSKNELLNVVKNTKLSYLLIIGDFNNIPTLTETMIVQLDQM